MKKFLALILVVIFFVSCKELPKNIKTAGGVFGTTYSVVYASTDNYQKQFDSLFEVINKSMSTYIPNSIISKVNTNKSVRVDSHFSTVFNASDSIYKSTNGVFDPTIGAVVNAWDFGPKGEVKKLDSLKLDSLMLSVGFNKVRIENGGIKKESPNTQLDFNAIAKGYAVDVIADFLENKKCTNYLVEIGGELRTKGKNLDKNKQWAVGIDKPNFEGTQSVFKVIKLQDKAMATSGTYRKFKVDENGKRYAHIINAKNGYPSKTNILSVSVVTDKCIIADGYATAFQAMGVEKVKTFLKTHPELQVFLIFEDEMNTIQTLSLNGFE